MLAVFTVTETYDGVVDGAGDAPGTLRQAIFDADFLAGPDIINFDSSLQGATITLGKDSSGTGITSLEGPAGALSITDSVTIVGKDSNGVLLNITIDASGTDPTSISTLDDKTEDIFGVEMLNTANDGDGSSVFKIVFSTVDSEQEVILDSLTITGGDTSGAGGGIFFSGTSNGTTGYAKLTVRDSTIFDNYSLAV